MSMLASTSTACYSCVLAQAASRTIKASTSTTIRFLSDVPGPDSGARKRKWKDVVWPHPSTLQTKSLIGELERLRNEAGVKIHESVFATGRKMLRDGPPRSSEEPENKPQWRLHREALKEKFPEGWNPPRRVERSDMNTIRRLHSLDPVQFSTPNLADKFKISAEAVRRILKSKYRSEEELEEAKAGDALLKEAELGSYDKTEARPRFASKRMMASTGEGDSVANRRSGLSSRSKYPERTSIPAKPLQEGFDPSKMSKNYKWAAGRQSKYADSKRQEDESERSWKQAWQGERPVALQGRSGWQDQDR